MWLLPALMLGCSPEPGALDLPTDATPPPVQITGDGLAPGQQARFRVRGAPVGATVALYATRGGTGPGGCFAPNLCLDLLEPVRLVATSTIGGAGIATLPLTVPAGFAPGTVVHLQAYATNGRGAALSPVLTRVVDDGDFDSFLGDADNCPGTANDDQGDADGDGDGDVCDCAPFDDSIGAGALEYRPGGVHRDCFGVAPDPSPYDGVWSLYWELEESDGFFAQSSSGELELTVRGPSGTGSGSAVLTGFPAATFDVDAVTTIDVTTGDVIGTLAYPNGSFRWSTTISGDAFEAVLDPVNSLGHTVDGFLVGERTAP